jgi:rare lipoprotein A
MRAISRYRNVPRAGILALLFIVSCATENSFVKTRDYRNAKYGAAADNTGYEEESNDFGGAETVKENKWSDKKASTSEENSEKGAGDASYKKEKYFQTGMASWYGREFNGKKTASGEQFNMNGLTAAHKTLPFGTVLKVKNFDNGKIVTVRVNDRGPYKGNRIIDLSYGAAKKIGMLQEGESQVGIMILKNGEETGDYERDNENSRNGDLEAVSDDSDNESASGSGSYAVQAGAFYSKRNAENLKTKIEGMTKNSVIITRDGDMYKVRIEGFSSQKEVSRMKQTLSEDNIPSYLIKNHKDE